MAQHVKILGILHIVFGALGVLGAIIVLMIFGGLSAFVNLSDHGSDVPGPVLGIIGGVLFIVILVLSLPALIIGVGLIQFRPWGRIGGIVLSVLDLPLFPIHTILGIYGLWVLLNRETEMMFAAPRARVA
ncbi:MAG TPA: hypothetical protein VFW44_05490 [Bryobacteraceae bacterium]|nr:hypothetical protein [Bryobacteraceae bacterium]